MSLAGLTVAITASRRASELAQLVSNFGGVPYLAPTVGIEASHESSNEVKSFISIVKEGLDYAIFMTGPGVYSLISVARELGEEKKLIEALQKATIVARSSKPKSALANHGLRTDIVPGENTAEGIAKALKNLDMRGKKVTVLWHGSYTPLLKEELQSVGASVFEFSTYMYSLDLKESGAQILGAMGFKYVAPDESRVVKLIRDTSNNIIDAITFTSPPSARNLFEIGRKHQFESLQHSLNSNVIVVAVGPPTSKAIEENGVNVDVMPEVYKMGPMVKALMDYVSRADTPKLRMRARTQTARADQLG